MKSISDTEKDRLDYVDLFRGLGIILMIMGHVQFGEVFDKIIHAFHMPMFFFISGYFYKSKLDVPLIRIIGKKAKTLLLPYLIFAFFHYCFYYMIVIRRIDIVMLKSVIYNSPNPTIPIGGALWFLTALFLTDVIYLIIDRIFAFSLGIKNIVIISIVAVGMLFGNSIPYRLPFSLDISMVCLGYYHLARKLKEKDFQMINVFHLKKWIICIMLVVASVLLFLNGYVNIRLTVYSNPLLFWINSILITIIGWNICRIIYSFRDRIPLLFRKIIDLINNIGRDSITYLCLNQITILFLNKVMIHCGINILLSKLIVLIITMILLFFINKVIMNTKFRIMVGK